MISLKQTINGCMSKEKSDWEKSDFLTYYICRPISYLFTWPIVNTGISANAVSFFSIFVVLTSLCFFEFGQSLVFYLIGWGLLFFWTILDSVDGNVARFKNTCSKKGELWDAAAGYIAISCFFFSSSIVAFSEESILLDGLFSDKIYYFLGGISIIACLLPRLLMHKKASLLGDQNVTSEFVERTKFSVFKIILNNLVSFTGFPLFLFLFAVIFNFCNLFSIFYTALNVAICIYSIFNLLRK